METEGSGLNGDDEGNTKSESQYGALSGEESIKNVLSGEHCDSTLLVYSLLRVTEDSKIEWNQGIDFEFWWDTIHVKILEFVHAENFMCLMSREYGPLYKYRVVNDYCAKVNQRHSNFRDTLALKVMRNVMSGKNNRCEIVSIKCIEKKIDETLSEGQKETIKHDNMPVVKTEKMEETGDGQSGSQRLAHVARHPVTQEEWSVIQKLRAQGKNIFN